MFYLCFYIWMTQNTERRGWRWARGWISMVRPPPYAGFVRGEGGEEAVWAERCLPFKCPSSVQPVREGRQCWWQLVTETAGCPTSPCLWSTARWHLGQKRKKERESGGKRHLWLIKTAGQTPCLRQQETSATRTPGWHVRQYLLCHERPTTPSSSFHLPLPRGLTHQASGHWGLSAKPSNLSALSFSSTPNLNMKRDPLLPSQRPSL